MNDHMHSCPNRPPIETKRGKLGVGRWGMEGKRREEKKKMKKYVHMSEACMAMELWVRSGWCCNLVGGT